MTCKHGAACAHQVIERGIAYEQCRDCLAVRLIPMPGKRADDWHLCADCCGACHAEGRKG
jgi:hypothetical protein